MCPLSVSSVSRGQFFMLWDWHELSWSSISSAGRAPGWHLAFLEVGRKKQTLRYALLWVASNMATPIDVRTCKNWILHVKTLNSEETWIKPVWHAAIRLINWLSLTHDVKINKKLSYRRERAHLTSLCRTVKRNFNVLNRLSVDHECDKQTDGQIANISNSALSQLTCALKWI